MHTLWPLVLFSLVSSGTPGPNNALLWTSGLQFGFGRTLPQVVGTALGIGGLAVAVAAGVGAVVTAVPAVDTALKVAGSAYLLYLACLVAVGGGAHAARLARPLKARQAIAFQFLNPKAWLFALAAMAAFRPRGWNVVSASALVAVIMMAVVIVTASAWAAGGALLHRRHGQRGQTPLAVSVALAALLTASVAFIWI